MIWLRRVAAGALGVPLLALLLLPTLTLQSVNGTVLNPDFYADRLKEADVYGFVMGSALTSAVDEAREENPNEAGVDLRENPVEASGLSTAQVVEAAQRALSPDDLEALVTPAILEAGGYATGRSDGFTIDLPLAETIRDVVDELLALLREAGAYERLLDQELEPRIREAAGEALAPGSDSPGWMQRLFGSDEEAGGRLAAVILSVVTPEWFQDQVEQIVNQLTGYLVGESDSFEIEVRLSDAQVDAAVDELKSVLGETDAAELVYTDILDPAVDDGVEEAIVLPYGVEVSREEIKRVLREVAPADWVQQQAELLIEDVSAYVTGRSEGFTTSISLAGHKDAAAGLLTELAVARVEESVRGLPACPPDAEASALAALGSGRLPDCLPPGVPADDLLADAQAAIAGAISELVLETVPDAVTYTDADLRLEVREDGGPAALDALDDSRELLASGWSYSERDLRAGLAADPEVLRNLDRVRAFLADGYVHTPDDPAASALAMALDGMHEASSAVRSGGRGAWLIVAVLLVAIGALGGTSWAGRVAWASAALLASVVVVLILFWPVYEGISGTLVELAREEIADWSDEQAGPTERLLAGKAVDVAEGAADEFAEGVRRSGLVLAIVALAVLLAAIVSGRFSGSDRTLQEQALDGR